MAIKLERQKPEHLLLSIAYKLKKILLFTKETMFKLFLDLEWIFDRLELSILIDEFGLKILKEEYRFGAQKIWFQVNKN